MNVSPFSAFKRDRRRQARMVLVIGLILTVGMVLQVGQLPTCVGTVAVADAERMYLVGMNHPQTDREPAFLAVSSPDGIHWSHPIESSGEVRAATAGEGRLYCLLALKEGATQLNSYGEKTWEGGEDWKVIETPFDWTPTGLGYARDSLYVFGLKPLGKEKERESEAGQDPSGQEPPAQPEEPPEQTALTLYSACRVDGAWVQGPTLEVADGLPVNLHLVTQKDATFLYWQLIPLDRAGLNERLCRARFDGTSFGPIESFDLDESMVCVLTGEPDRTVVLASRRILGPWQGASRPMRFVIERARMRRKADIDIPSFRKNGLSTDDFTMTRFADRTWLLIGGRTLGLFYRGMYAFGLDESVAGEGVRIFGPSAGQVAAMVFCSAGVMITLSVLVGSGVGFLRKSVASRPTTPDAMPYATVLERAVATGLDVSLLSIISWVMVSVVHRGPGEAAAATLLAFVVYATASESADGRTLGKRIFGIQVLSLSQGRVTVMQALLRNLVKPVDLLTTGVAMMLGSTRFQRLGDLVAGTVVVSNPVMGRGDAEVTDESGR